MVETTEATQVTRAASSLLFPELDFEIAANGTYPSEDFQRVLARIAFDNEFANTGAKAYQLARGDDIAIDATARNPLARALLYHLRGLDAGAVDDQFDRVRDAILDEAARNRVFTRPVDVAIDVHDWLYYGDEETPHVCTTNPAQGTDRAYKFATVCIVDPSVRFTLGSVVLEGSDTDELADSLRQLVSEVREYVDINRLYLDRGFYRVHLALALEDLDVEFLMRAPQTRKVQQFIDDHDSDTFIAEYEMARSNPPTGRTSVRLVVVPHRTRDDDHFCLVTNRDFDVDTDVEIARPLAEAYRRRWGIETSYRKITEFLPRTSSPTFSVRLFYFLFAVALYNLWVLTNLLVTPRRAVGTDPVVPTALFRAFLGQIPYG
ncbi:transposase [Natrialba taiwanensis]|uniref:Transposase IS4 family protein n=1 Tax=Natrialba taiwanensis DSM 12281 TaxID=1230458 RepID=M0A750_9EURY|nr:transposase [Natrialba taiwanensis]ELY93722.1 transposase IS4 family protein [Natrialba taiwanensis DSM 12281]